MMRVLTVFAVLLLFTPLQLPAADYGLTAITQRPPLDLAPDPLWLAAADTPTGNPDAVVAAEPLPPMAPRFGANKLHQYLGIGSLTLATLALLSPKDDDEGGAHHFFGQSAALLGGAAVASGLIVHWEDVGIKGGVRDPDNQHAFLATLGALGFAMAVSQAPEESHAAFGATGFVAMLVGVRLTW